MIHLLGEPGVLARCSSTNSLKRLLWAAALGLPAYGAQADTPPTTFHSFQPFPNGANPDAGLVQGSDGNFYGTTSRTVFKMTPAGVLTTLVHPGSPSGLVQGSDGSFYGTTYGGGGSNNGTVFKISTNGTLTSLCSFTGGNDGGNPRAGLVQGSDGSFYGTTGSGGLRGYGTVFRLTIMPEFQAVTLTSNGLNLTWSTEAGGTHQWQCSSDLDSTNWTNLGSAVTATGATLSATDFATNGSRRFYRVVLLP